VDPLNFHPGRAAAAAARSLADDSTYNDVLDAALITVNGIAAGMKNTG